MARKHTPLDPTTRPPSDAEWILTREVLAYFTFRTQGLTPSAVGIAAWGEFFNLCDPMIRRCAGFRHVSGSDLDDIAQEVWLRIIAHLGQFRPIQTGVHLRAWIATLVRNVAADMGRELTRHPRKCLSDEIIARLVSGLRGPSDEYENSQSRVLMRNALDELAYRVSVLNYRVLHLRTIEEHSVREVAAALEITSGQVRLRHHRMLKKLRHLIEVLGEGLADDEVP